MSGERYKIFADGRQGRVYDTLLRTSVFQGTIAEAVRTAAGLNK